MATKKIGIETMFVPLSMLDEDPGNPRRTDRRAGVEALAASIAAHGLLQPLGVVPGDKDGRHTVKFGGRRLAALRLLAESKKIGRTAGIACRTLTEKEAAEAALAENVSRIAMHPADEFEAFSDLHAAGAGLSVEQIATRFGMSAHTVRQRLRLAGISPVILAHYRDGRLTLEQVMAFTVTDDHAAQERVMEALPEYLRSAHSIRSQLTQGDVSTTDRRAMFVGVAAYEAAGGAVRRDLFTEGDGGWLTDPTLLDRLVLDRLTREAEAIKGEGWAWVQPVVPLPPAIHAMRRIYPETVALSQEDEAQLQVLTERLDAAEQGAEGEDFTEEDAEISRIQEQIDAIRDREEAYQADDMARAGAFVSLGWDGRLSVTRGLLRADADDVDAPVQDGEGEAEGRVVPFASAGGAQQAKPVGLSDALRGELAAHRTAGLQAEVAMRPHLALCLLIQALLQGGDDTCHARVLPPALHAACPGIDETEARKQLAETEAPFAAWKLPERGALLPWLVERDTETLLAILAPLVARGVDAGCQTWDAADAGHGAAQVAGIALLDMRRFWQPTVASYLGRVSKAQILDAVRDGAGAAAAKRLEGMKKEPMAEAAAGLLDGKGWLPALLRTPTLPETAEDEEDELMAAAAD